MFPDNYTGRIIRDKLALQSKPCVCSTGQLSCKLSDRFPINVRDTCLKMRFFYGWSFSFTDDRHETPKALPLGNTTPSTSQQSNPQTSREKYDSKENLIDDSPVEIDDCSAQEYEIMKVRTQSVLFLRCKILSSNL